MKLVMTLVVRDEDDVLETNLDYHLNQGVDFVIATDNDSRDGTLEILERYASSGQLHLIRESGTYSSKREWDARQSEWQTRMARLAAVEFGADWVIHDDADEFWWPLSGTLKDVFAAIPRRFGVLGAPKVDFVPRPDDGRSIIDRMTVREVMSGVAAPKAAHRALPDIVVAHMGDHGIWREGAGPCSAPDGAPAMLALPYWPIRIFHFPVRSAAQLEKRVRRGGRVSGKLVRGARRRRSELERAYEEGRISDFYASKVVDDHSVEAGIRDGHLVVDRRFQRFSAVGASEATPRSPGNGPGAAESEASQVQADMMLAVQVRTNKLTCSNRRLQDRLSEIERSYWWRLGQFLSPVLRAAGRLPRILRGSAARRPRERRGKPNTSS
jgi:hypothetical protein